MREVKKLSWVEFLNQYVSSVDEAITFVRGK